MIHLLVPLIGVFLSPPTGMPVEFQVVGVFRPVDLSGRTVQTPRDVYLQSSMEDFDITPFIGLTLDVWRSSPVPAMINMRKRLDDAQEEKTPNASGQPSNGQTQLADGSVGRTGAAYTLKPASRLPSVDDGKPAGFATRPRAASKKHPVFLGADVPEGDRIDALKPEQVRVETIERAIGRIKIIAVRGDVAIARVISDGLGMSPKGQSQLVPDEIPTIMAGDIARGKRPIPVGNDKKKAKRLSPRAKKKLAREQKQVERAVQRKGKRLKPFTRETMRWDL